MSEKAELLNTLDARDSGPETAHVRAKDGPFCGWKMRPGAPTDAELRAAHDAQPMPETLLQETLLLHLHEDGMVFSGDAARYGCTVRELVGAMRGLTAMGVAEEVSAGIWIDPVRRLTGAEVFEGAFVERPGRLIGHWTGLTAAYRLGILPVKWEADWPECLGVASMRRGASCHSRDVLGQRVSVVEPLAPVTARNRRTLELLSALPLLREEPSDGTAWRRARELAPTWGVHFSEIRRLLPLLSGPDERLACEAIRRLPLGGR